MASSPLDEFYSNLPEPEKSTYLFIRRHLLEDPDMSESFKWSLPFFDYKGKYFCYLYQNKKSKLPYIAFSQGKHIDHPALYFGDRTQIGAILFDPNEDLPMKTIDEVVALAKKVHFNKIGRKK